MSFDDILDQFKKGIHSSEFWFLVVGAVYLAVKNAWDPSKSITQNILVAAPLAGAAIYATCRTWLKTKRAAVINPGDYQPTPALPPVDVSLEGEDAEDSATVGGTPSGN